jgi:hypothetical protein
VVQQKNKINFFTKMFKLNWDILYLILKESQDDRKFLCLFLSVNKACCQITVSILWENPWRNLTKTMRKKLIDIIISHLSDESRNILTSQGIHLKYLYEKLLFDYISFCKYLYMDVFRDIIYSLIKDPIDRENSIIQNEIIKLFINENTRFTHLYVPPEFNYQLNLIPETKQCFSEIIFLRCNADMNNKAFTGLTGMSESVRELELKIKAVINYDVTRLIDTFQKLTNVKLLYDNHNYDGLFDKILEKSLIKHANTMQYFKITRQPVTNILSSFVNLKELELCCYQYHSWNCLENLSLPFLKILKTRAVPVGKLAKLIENTSGHLTKISTDYKSHNVMNNKKIIQAIYQKCPKLEYLKLNLKSSNITEFEKILINCQYLNQLFIIVDNLFEQQELFEILSKSSPTSLYNFILHNLSIPINLKSLKLFFDNWKGRHPMFLHFSFDHGRCFDYDLIDLIKEYVRKGIIEYWY